jgi:DNA-binding NtrC family response regulator
MRLLVVDDDYRVLEMLLACLEDEGFEVMLAASATDAMARELDVPPDVLVTDLDLGEGSNGIDLASEARRRWPDLRVVYMSGQPWPKGVVPVGGNETFLPKPFKVSALVRGVHSVTGGSA